VKTLADLHAWAASAPAGTLVTVPADRLAALLEGVEHAAPSPAADQPRTPWRALLWIVDAETRIGRDELLEATGRPLSWLHRHTGPKSTDRIPHRRDEGQLVFIVGEVRHWLKAREQVVEAGPMDTSRTLRSVKGGR
jgi:hypothetical protein